MNLKFACAVLALAIQSPVHAEDYLTAADSTEWEAGGFYEGQFQDGTRFQINLPYAPNGQYDLMHASYWYPKTYRGQRIQLVRTVAGSGRLTLVSRANGARIDETFQVKLSADRKSATGQWRSARLRNGMSFKLQRVAPYRATVVTRPFTGAEKGDTTQRTFSFTAVFPQLGDRQVDLDIRKWAGQCESDLTCTHETLITWKSPELVSLDAYAWGYGHGAAHGNGGSTTHHYRVEKSGLRAVDLDHFIDQGGECGARISKVIVDTLTAQKFSWPEAGALNKQSKPAFTATAHGLLFQFDPYAVGSYAQGATSVFVPLAKGHACVKYLPALSTVGRAS